MNLNDSPTFKAMDIQTSGGTPGTVRKGLELLHEMAAKANECQRESVPAGKLVLALECGGSDAYSGITANPALGVASDLVVRNGGTVILSETTEIFGAEHLLVRRAVSEEVGRKLLDRIQWWKEYTERLGATLNNNPSPGNKAGGLTTILEKSLGAVSKAGSTDLVDVYHYAEPVTAKGLVLMDTPGYDAVSLTGMIAGGANLGCFTTGRGSVFGTRPVPILKLATNTFMYERMPDDMDLNCGRIIDGDSTLEETGELLFRKILATASGAKSKSEQHGFSVSEFVPWWIGATV